MIKSRTQLSTHKVSSTGLSFCTFVAREVRCGSSATAKKFSLEVSIPERSSAVSDKRYVTT